MYGEALFKALSKLERFAKIVNNFQPLPIFTKRSILDVWQGTEF